MMSHWGNSEGLASITGHISTGLDLYVKYYLNIKRTSGFPLSNPHHCLLSSPKINFRRNR